MRRLLKGGAADLPAVLREVQEAEHELELARVMIEAAIHQADQD